jgi:hypothetical protein
MALSHLRRLSLLVLLWFLVLIYPVML